MNVNLMKINISSFFEFPGILITIGVILLLTSIILIIIAYNTIDKEEQKSLMIDDDINKNEVSNMENVLNKEVEDEVKVDIKSTDDESNNESEEFDLTKVFAVLEENDTINSEVFNAEKKKDDSSLEIKVEEKKSKNNNKKQNEELIDDTEIL